MVYHLCPSQGAPRPIGVLPNTCAKLMPLPTIMERNMTLVETKPSYIDCPLSASIAVGNCCVVERVSNWLNSSTTCPEDEELMDLYAMAGVQWTLFCVFQDVLTEKDCAYELSCKANKTI